MSKPDAVVTLCHTIGTADDIINQNLSDIVVVEVIDGIHAIVSKQGLYSDLISKLKCVTLRIDESACLYSDAFRVSCNLETLKWELNKTFNVKWTVTGLVLNTNLNLNVWEY